MGTNEGESRAGWSIESLESLQDPTLKAAERAGLATPVDYVQAELTCIGITERLGGKFVLLRLSQGEQTLQHDRIPEWDPQQTVAVPLEALPDVISQQAVTLFSSGPEGQTGELKILAWANPNAEKPAELCLDGFELCSAAVEEASEITRAAAPQTPLGNPEP